MSDASNGNSRKRAWLAKRLKLEEEVDRFEILWSTLEDRGIIEDWERGRTSEEDVLEDARIERDRFRAWEGRSSLPERRQARAQSVHDIPVELTERERGMTDALREYFAAHAASRPLVQKFRREELPEGRLLVRDQEIWAFLNAELQIAPDVEEYLEKYLDSTQDDLPTVVPFALRSAPPSDDDPSYMAHEDVTDQIAEIGAEKEERIDEDWHGPAGWLLEVLGRWLVEEYPWRSMEDAVVFLISGRPPRLAEPLGASFDWRRATYSITFLPWVSEETITRAYRATQRLLIDGRPTRRELPGDKTVRVLRFVTAQADDGRLPSWSELWRRWNADNSNERYSDRSAMYRAYKRAVEALVPPHLPLT